MLSGYWARTRSDMPHARRRSRKRDLEMVFARQALLGHVRHDRAHHPAQGGLGEQVVADVVFGHWGAVLSNQQSEWQVQAKTPIAEVQTSRAGPIADC